MTRRVGKGGPYFHVIARRSTRRAHRVLSRVGTALRAFAHPTLLLLLLALPAMADKLDDVKARGTLMIGVAESSPPFSFLLASEAGPVPRHLGAKNDNNIVGYDVDLSAAVANRLGVALKKVAIINAERIPSLRDG